MAFLFANIEFLSGLVWTWNDLSIQKRVWKVRETVKPIQFCLGFVVGCVK